MSFGFELNEKPPVNILAGGNVESIEDYSPSYFEGIGSGMGDGFMKGGANVARFVGMAGAIAPIAYDAAANIYDAAKTVASGKKLDSSSHQESTAAQDWYFKNVIEGTLTNAVDYWTPDARQVGKAGQLLGGLAAIGLPLMAGGGNPSILMGDSYLNPALDLVNKGVDSKTASTVGALNAAAVGVGFYLPFLGKNLTQRMTSGVVGNLAVNTATTAVQQQVLKAGDYNDAAEMYDPLNTDARALDVLMGAVFGGIAHLKAPRILPSQRDALLTATNARNFQQDSAPGNPLDDVSSVAHQNALTESLNQISRGEQVDVAAMLENSAFIQRNRGEDPTITLPENLADEVIPQDGLTNADQMVEMRTAETLSSELQSRVNSDFESIAHDYNKIDGTDGGRVLDTDLARELSEGYKHDRTKASEVQDAASAVIQKLYEQKLANPTPDGLTPDVVFMAGGTGAGKSTVKEALKDKLKNVETVYDTTMSDMASADKKIQQALVANRDVTIIYTYRDPMDAFVIGSLGRAAKAEAEAGTGRTTPIDVFIEKHVGAQKTIAEIIEKYKGDSRVNIRAYDNSNGKGNHKGVDFAQIPKIDDTGLRGKLYDAAIKEYEAGRISEAIFNSTTKNARAAEGVGRPTDGGLNDKHEQADTGNNAKNTLTDSALTDTATNPDISAHDISAAQKILFETPDLVVTLDDGTRTTARELMDSMAAETKLFESDSKAYEAAVNCFLGGA